MRRLLIPLLVAVLMLGVLIPPAAAHAPPRDCLRRNGWAFCTTKHRVFMSGAIIRVFAPRTNRWAGTRCVHIRSIHRGGEYRRGEFRRRGRAARRIHTYNVGQRPQRQRVYPKRRLPCSDRIIHRF